MPNPLSDDLQYIATLLPFNDEGYGTGAVLLSPDSRDFDMARIPEVRIMLEVGTPPSYEGMLAYIKGTYNQGQIPSCVAHSTAGMKSIEDMLEHSVWNTYDAPALYRDNGGTGQNGVDTRRVLQYAQDTGVLVLNGTARYRIGSYAFAPRVAGQFEETIKAAVAANMPCVLALLLPQNFGWDSSGGITQGYHQVVIAGYTEQYVIILNSWGAGWGNGGLGRVPWAFIIQDNFQNGYAYAYTVIDGLDKDLQPPPVPDPAPRVFELSNIERVKVGLPAYALDSRLAFAAAKYAKKMGTENFFDHISPDGSTFISRIKAEGVIATAMGENIGAGQLTAEQMVQAWMASAGHKANILQSAFTHMGAGYANVPGSRYTHYWVQCFAQEGVLPPVNKPPIANAGGPYSAKVGQAITFDGSRSSDPDGTIQQYGWNFGDGLSAVGVRPIHDYKAEGTYEVTLTVTDNQGATSKSSTSAVIAQDTPPPVMLKVDGYTDVLQVASVMSRSTFGIRGTFPLVGIIQVSWVGQSLKLINRNATSLTVEAPTVLVAAIGPIKVQLEGEATFGPLLVILPNTTPPPPPPPPVGELTVAARMVRLGVSYSLYTTVTDPAGKDMTGTVMTAMIGTTMLANRTMQSNGQATIWAVASSLLANGIQIAVRAFATDGRKGVASFTFQAGELVPTDRDRDQQVTVGDDEGDTAIGEAVSVFQIVD